eukprot:GILI01022590.1.p1 GENE.GILI01022590.1~~GILI01022590.1.p1  ORF type:complete len:195 (-),score=25.40 GILI01022590.1:91-675(-)
MATRTEKEKMLAGEPYFANEEQLVAERLACRYSLRTLNNSISNTDEWRQAVTKLAPNAHPGAHLEPPFYCDYGYNLYLGKNFYCNFNCTILDVNKVTIGDNCMLAPNVQIYTAGHPVDAERRISGEEFGLEIKIGDNVWIGGGAIICPGVTIGNNTVIGAGSVVTKSLPDNVVAVGNPAKVLRVIAQGEPKPTA